MLPPLRPLVVQVGVRIARSGVRTPHAPLRALKAPVRGYASKPRQGVVSYAAKLMADPVIETVLLASRIARILVSSALVVGSVTFAVWEGAHQYVEHVAMPRTGAVEPASPNDAFGWEMDDVLYHLGMPASTDARLGTFGRHIVRSAWMAEHWGGGIAPQSIFGLAPRGLPVKEMPDFEAHQGLRLAERFLSTSLHIADARNIRVQEFEHTDKPLDATAVALETWLAQLRTKLSTPAALAQAGLGYEKLYDAYALQPHAGPICAWLAMRMGTLQEQLGQHDASLAWLDRALHEPTAALVDAALADRYMLRTPLHTRLAVQLLKRLSRVHVHEATTSPAPRHGLYAALRAQLAALHLTRAEQVRLGTGADADLQRAWTHKAQSEMAVQIAETLYALQQHGVDRSWRAWFGGDKLLATRPEAFGKTEPVAPGAYESSRTWLLFAADRAASVRVQLSAEALASSFARPSRQHAAERIRDAAEQTEKEAFLLLRTLEKRAT